MWIKSRPRTNIIAISLLIIYGESSDFLSSKSTLGESGINIVFSKAHSELNVLWSFVISLMRQMHIISYVRGRWSKKKKFTPPLAEGLAYLLTLSYFGLKGRRARSGDFGVTGVKKYIYIYIYLVFGKAPIHCIVLRTVPFFPLPPFFPGSHTHFFWDLFLNLTLHFYFIWACMCRFSLCSGNFFIIPICSGKLPGACGS